MASQFSPECGGRKAATEKQQSVQNQLMGRMKTVERILLFRSLKVKEEEPGPEMTRQEGKDGSDGDGSGNHCSINSSPNSQAGLVIWIWIGHTLIYIYAAIAFTLPPGNTGEDSSEKNLGDLA